MRGKRPFWTVIDRLSSTLSAHLLRALPHDSRTTSSTGSTETGGAVAGFSIIWTSERARSRAEAALVLADRGQRGADELRELDVVEADDGDVLGAAEAGVLEGLIAPTAIRSDAAKTAVGGSGSARSARIAASPLSM